MLDTITEEPKVQSTDNSPFSSTRVTNDPNEIYDSMPKGFDLNALNKAYAEGKFNHIDPDKEYVDPLSFTPINLDDMAKGEDEHTVPNSTNLSKDLITRQLPFDPYDSEYDVEPDVDTQKLKSTDLTFLNTIHEQTRTVGKPKPEPAPSKTENTFTHYMGIATRKENSEITGQEVAKNDDFRIMRQEDGSYTVVYNSGHQALALKNGNRMIITIMQTGEGSRSKGAEYKKYDVELKNLSTDEMRTDYEKEVELRANMGERFKRLAKSKLESLLPGISDSIPTTYIEPRLNEHLSPFARFTNLFKGRK
jgi:hypothetical protein